MRARPAGRTVALAMTVSDTLLAGRHPRTWLRLDVVVDAAIAGVVLALTLTTGPRDALRAFDGAGVVLALLASLPLLARRRAPLAVFAAVSAASAGLLALGYTDAAAGGTLVALYSLG